MLSRLLSWSIEKRWLVVALTVLATAYGAWSLTRLPIDAVPDITNVQVQINAQLASLGPEEIEKQVTQPLETALAGIPGLEATRSLSRNGFCQITAVFAEGTDIYFARNQVGERMASAREQLPPGLDVDMGPIATGLGEIYMWTVSYAHPAGAGAAFRPGSPGWQKPETYLTPEGQTLTTPVELATYLRTVQDWTIRPQLKAVAGVAGIDAIGGYAKQYHVTVDPQRLASYGLTMGHVINALEQNNHSAGAGYVDQHGEALTVRTTGRLQNPQDIAQVAVGVHRGVPILIGQVAQVAVGAELRTGSASTRGSEAVVGTAVMRVGQNSRTVAAAVDEKMASVRRSLPPDIQVETVLNRTKLVQATVSTVAASLGEGALLVVVVLLLLLGNLRAALVTALAIPISMALTASGMLHFGISGNLMSLGAIDFGLIVDGAVIIAENCLRRLAERQRQEQRLLTRAERLMVVRDAAQEVRGATAFGEAIIITVYLPILALGGVEGKMFHPMALTVILALGAAFVLSLTFVPAVVALAVSGRIQEHENLGMRWALRAYTPVLRIALRWRKSVVLTAAALFAAALALVPGLGQEFAPTLDEQDLVIQSLRIPSTALSQSTAMQLQVERVVQRFAEVQVMFSKTGTAELAADPMPPNISDGFIILKPRDQWPDPKRPKAELLEAIEAAVTVLPGNAYEATQPIQMRFNELLSGDRGDVVVRLYGDDFAKLEPAAQRIAAVLGKVPGATAVKVEQTGGLPSLTIEPDREALGRHGIAVREVNDVVGAAIGGREVGQLYEGDRRVALVVRLREELRTDVDQLRRLPIPLPPPGDSAAEPALGTTLGSAARPTQSAALPLASLARVSVAEGRNQISRTDGKRRIVVQCNVRGRDLGSFVQEAQAKLAALPLPPGSWLGWGGQFENLVAARERLAIVVPLCFLLILGMLYASFRSMRSALLVFSGVPLGWSGGILALWLRGMPLSISAAVGFIALSGVAVLNGLVMVTFIRQRLADGQEPGLAIEQGALTRLRPVLTTAMVASLGFVPMALASGTGAEVQQPLATVVIGGLLSSTLLTLGVLPALVSWLGGGRVHQGEG